MYHRRGLTILALMVLSTALPSKAASGPTEASEVRANHTMSGAMAPWIAGRLAVQLYSFRADVEKDLTTTLQTIRRLGFERVELYPVPGVSAATMRAALDTADLHAISAHVPLDSLESNLPSVIADAKQLGLSRVGVPWIKPRTSEPGAPLSQAEADAAVAIFKKACRPLHAAGIRLFLHNHGYEGVSAGGRTMLDRILSTVSPDCLDLQIDVFWAATAGMNPAQLIRDYRPRVWSVHLKDRRQGAISQTAWTAEKRDSVVLGEGTLDIGAILAAARTARVGSLIIEDESPEAEQQIKRSLDYLRHYH